MSENQGNVSLSGTRLIWAHGVNLATNPSGEHNATANFTKAVVDGDEVLRRERMDPSVDGPSQVSLSNGEIVATVGKVVKAVGTSGDDATVGAAVINGLASALEAKRKSLIPPAPKDGEGGE